MDAKPPAYDVEAIRADFPILSREIHGKPLVYLDNGASAQKPQVVIDAISRAYSSEYANVHRGLHFLSNAATDAYEKDENVRYFINVQDAVSMGGFGHSAPSNVVYRTQGNPLTAHKLAQWQGSSAYQAPIYHAPPETRVHAHKAWFGDRVQERPFEDQLTDGEYLIGRSRVVGGYDKEHPPPPEDAAGYMGTDAAADRALDEGPTFDFGDYEEPYNYALL